MKLWFRMIPMAFRGLAQGRLNVTEPLRTRFQVLPFDLDVNLHLNNGRYLQIIDVNRLEWLWRTGILGACVKRRWTPILGGSAIHFRRELRLFDHAVAETRLLGWDERWFFLEHRIERADGRTAATAVAKAAFRSPGAWVPSAAMQQLIAPDMCRPELPDHVRDWQGVDAGLARMGRRRDTCAD